MNMHEHDQDLIMALAEGTLDEAAAAAARTEISMCPECSRDLELQRIALAALGDLQPVYLTAAESSRLHDTLKRGLDVATPKAAPHRSGISWGRWIPVLGVAAVLLIAVLALPNMIGGSDESADTAMMAAAETTITTAAMEGAQTPRAALETTTAAAGESQNSASGMQEDTAAAATTTTAAAETTTTAMAETTTTAASQGGEGLLPYLGDVADLDENELVSLVAATLEDLRARSLETRAADSELDECLATDTTEFDPSLGLPNDAEPIVLGMVTGTSGEQLFLVAYVPPDVEQTVFVTMRSPGCDLVARLFR
jgi:hypothetical protein